MAITLERTPIQTQYAVKAFAECGASVSSICKQFDLSHHTVNAIKRSNKFDDARYETFKKYLPRQWGGLAWDTLNLCDRADIKKAPIQTRVWIAGVATDKMQSLEGTNRPVFNVVTVVQTLEKRLKDLDVQSKALLALEGK